MTGVGGDAFMMVYSAKTKKLEGLNASGRAPRALNLDYFTSRKIAQMPMTGMEPITVPGAFDGWVTLLDKHGTMKLADLLAPAIDYAENGFPSWRRSSADWVPNRQAQADAGGRGHLPRQRRRAEARRHLLSEESGPHAPHAGARRTRRVLSRRDRPGHRRLLPEERRLPVDGGLRRPQVGVGRADFDDLSRSHAPRAAAERPGTDGAAPRSTSSTASTWRSLRTRPGLYYHTLIEATKIAFADRNRYIADPAFAKVPVKELLSKDYAAGRRALDRSAEGDRPAGVRRRPPGQRHHLLHRRRQGSQRRLVHQQHLQRVRIGHRRGRHRHRAAEPRRRLLARARTSQSHRAGQAPVPHADSRDGVQGRSAAAGRTA